MKQKLIRGSCAGDIMDQVDTAMSYGWTVQSIVYGDGAWIAVMTKAE